MAQRAVRILRVWALVNVIRYRDMHELEVLPQRRHMALHAIGWPDVRNVA